MESSSSFQPVCQVFLQSQQGAMSPVVLVFARAGRRLWPRSRVWIGPISADALKTHRAVGGDECIVHFLIRLRRVHAFGVAPVVFEIIDAPGGVGLGVLEFVIFSAGVAGTGLGAGAVVNAEFETAFVEIIREGLHPLGEARSIGDEISVCIAILFRPSIVEVYIDITGIAHAVGDHRVCRGFDQLFVNVSLKSIPAIPAAWAAAGARSPAKTTPAAQMQQQLQMRKSACSRPSYSYT